jgi:phosphohistidine swiveling domain-containing protein
VGGDFVWSRRLADELWSGVVTPLTYGLLADVMAEHMVRRRLARAGLDRLADWPVLRLESGHVYVNASLVAEVMMELPSAFVSEGLLSLLPQALHDRVRRGGRSTLSPAVLATIAQLAVRERAWLPWTSAGQFRVETKRVARDLERHEDLRNLAPGEIAARIVGLRARLGEYLEVVSWAVVYAYVFFFLTAQLLQRWGGGEDIAPLLSGTGGIRTFEVHRELSDCADRVRSDETLRGALLEGAPEVVAARCLAGDHGELGRRVGALIRNHGHRLTARDLACPTWRERPAAVVEILRRLVVAGSKPESGVPLVEGASVEAEILARIAGGLSGRVRREALRLLLRWCREYYAVRENMRYHADVFLASLRELALAAGAALVATGSLVAAEDALYLMLEELLAALEGAPEAPEPATLRARAEERRNAYRAFRLVTPADTIVGDRVGEVGGRPVTASHPLRGIGVSPGRAVGPARVVRCLEDLEGIRQGDVIVAASTDPSWTSLLSLGRGLVLEMGGMLSHGAIVARELGIPAVANVSYATSVLRTGDRLVVDGGSGEVAVTAA